MSSPSDARLQQLRLHADPLADDAMAALLAHPTPGDLYARLRHAAALDPAAAPARLLHALEAVTLEVEPPQWRSGQRMFLRYGVLSLLTGITTLVESYAGIDNHVLMMSGRLSGQRAFRRLAETAKFTLEVVSHDALRHEAAGWEAVVRVRLLHAHVRHLCLTRGYDLEALGAPVNQLAMAGTLMLFSGGILRALSAIGARISFEERHSYHALWQHIGALLGVSPELLTASPEEEALLWERIKQIAFAPNANSVILFEQLVTALCAHAPSLPAHVRRQGAFLLEDERFVRQFVGRCVDPHYARHLGITPDPRYQARLAMLHTLVSGSTTLLAMMPAPLRLRADAHLDARVRDLTDSLLEHDPARWDDPGFEKQERIVHSRDS